VPSGILAQVSFLQTGGGSRSNGFDCENKPGEPRWCRPLNGASLILTSEYRGIACGLSSQPLQAWLVLPDGSTQPLRVAGEAPSCREISRPAGPNTPPGRYQVRVDQAGTSLVDTFQWVRPDQPHGTLLESGCAWVAGLASGQPMRLMVFGLSAPETATDPLLGSWHYLAELSLTGNLGGELWACPSLQVQKNFSQLAYLAVLPSGTLALGDEDLLRAFQGICFEGPATRLAVGARLRVLDQALPLFPDATLNGRPLGSLEAGKEGTLMNGPVCPPEGPWTWQASFGNNLTGWLAESNTTSYFVGPLP
jgi:hypothetical protein